MANVKSRLKAHKSAPKEKSSPGKNKKSSTGPSKALRPPVAMKHPSNLTYLTPDEKVEIILKNTNVLRDKLLKKTSRKRLIKSNNVSPKPRGIATTKCRPSKGLTCIDDILKRELLIKDSINLNPAYPKSNATNNNNVDITDQNSDKKCSSPKRKKSKNVTQPSTKEMAETPAQLKAKVNLSNGELPKIKSFQCDHCKKTFGTKNSIRRHVFIHFDMNKHTCKYCLRNFRTPGVLRTHLKRVHDVSKLTGSHLCHICDKRFADEDDLEVHLGSHIKSASSFQCTYCDMSFPHAFILSTHEKQHLVPRRYQCSVCPMGFDCRTKLSIHEKSHTEIKEYVCQICGKEFLRMNSMKRHVLSCHSEFSIQCPICKKKLKGHLTEHLRTHDKERPHKCPECGQGFTQSTQLNVHLRSHTGARPYPCRICNQPFSHSNALMLHIRRHTGEKPFACAMCPLSFSQLPHMKAHMLKIHGKQNPYKCKKCKEFFKLKVLLESHEKKCKVGDKPLPTAKEIEVSVNIDGAETESGMTLSHMRFLLALLLTIVATKEKLKYLGFNKRLIDDILVESLEGMGHKPCKDSTLAPLKRLKTNIQILLEGTVPMEQMEKFRSENKTTEELLELLTDGK